MDRTIALAAAGILLGGCGTDYDLHDQPPAVPSPEIAPEIGGPPGPPGSDPPSGGPWGDLDPGSLPEVYFAVAWEHDGSTLTDESGWIPDVRYGIIDLRGHVLATFEPPPPDDEAEPATVDHRDLLPAGPGRFLALSWGTTVADDDASGWVWANTEWLAWAGDGVTGDAAPVARKGWDDQGQFLEVIPRDWAVTTTWDTRVHAATDPADPGRALGATSWASCEGSTLALHALELEDPGVPAESWAIDDLLPPLLPDTHPWATAFTLRPGTDDAGDGSVLLGVRADDCAGDDQVVLTSWSADEGARWAASIDDLMSEQEISYSGRDGGAALYLTPGGVAGAYRWKLVGSVAAEGALDATTWPYPRVGPLLDPSGPSFMMIRQQSDLYADEIVVLHQGHPVWVIDTLTFGLEERAVRILDVVELPPVP